MSNQLLSGKVALVTGGLNGIGHAAIRKFHQNGAVVVMADILPKDAPLVAQRLRELGERAHYAWLDVTSETAWKAARDFCAETFGHVDILVNNAGGAVAGDTFTITLEDWNKLTLLNQTSVFLGTQIFADLLSVQGKTSDTWSAIVNVSSMLGIVAFQGAPAYSATKAAVRNFTKASALDFIATGRKVRVNSVHPGYVDTNLLREGANLVKGEENAQSNSALLPLIESTPMKRLARPEEIGEAILFLASPNNGFMTGAELVVDGGVLAM